MRKPGSWLILLILALGAVTSSAADSASDRIVFLHVEITDTEAKLVDVAIVDGRLKRPRQVHAYPGKIRFEVLDADANRLFEGVVEDPTRVVYEYADESGRLQSKVITRDRGIAVIRIPYDETAVAVSVSRVMDLMEQGTATRAAVRHLGTIAADWAEVIDDE